VAADRVFARRELARDMQAEGVAYEPFDDFVSVRAALGL
jgi:2-hydroxy-3-keto-5-methylthiopentenyl-1-phosphate phosphatase